MSTDDQIAPLACAGEYREFDPPAELRDHFQCVWSHTISPDETGCVTVVPDGCVDLIWIDGRLEVAGPDVAAAVSALKPGAAIVGVRFRPGAAVNWLRLPMSEMIGHRVDLRDLWGGRAHALAERVGDAETTSERMKSLESRLSRLAPAIDRPSGSMAFLFHALGKPDGPGSGMAAILHRLDVSPRTLRRRCYESFGYGPKTLDRILRFQRFLHLARRAGETRLWALAYDAGYADQAHLAREVRRLSGLTPSAVLRQVAA